MREFGLPMVTLTGVDHRIEFLGDSWGVVTSPPLVIASGELIASISKALIRFDTTDALMGVY